MAKSDVDLMRLAADERADLGDLLGTLTPEQWSAPSLCPEWTVRDVAAHVVSYDELSMLQLVAKFLQGGLRVNRVNDVVLRRYRDLAPDQIVDLVADHLEPHGLTSGFGGAIALTDGLIHHQDIRRALDLPRSIPPERLAHALDFALGAPTLPAKRNAKGLRLSATDLDWAAGGGPAVTGPAEALLMATAGRADALGDLTGPGLSTLSERVVRG